jgi:hypothetical protein
VSLDSRRPVRPLDRVPEGDLPVIRKLPLAVAWDLAPVGAEGELADSVRREIEAAEAYFAAGGSGISHDEILRLRQFGLG